MRALLIGLMMVVVAGCGAQQKRTYGLEEGSLLVVRAAQLVGATMTIDPSYRRSIAKDDLTPYQMGIAGAKDPEEQNLETITVKVTPGTHRVKVEKDGAVLLDQELYFSQGQTRELRIR